jgi:glycosyltransferase involved in cell wall biosynthesis
MAAERFSIVITCYNQCDFIRAAVDSALAQPDTWKEIIVVDDGSTDGSVKVLESYAGSIRLVKFTTNRGAIKARNHGASLARAEYLVFLDGDDVLMPWALDVYQRIAIERHPKIVLARSQWFEGSIPRLRSEDNPQQIDFVQYDALLKKDRSAGLSASTYLVDREVFWAAGGWSPGIFHLDCQDLSTKLGYSGRTILICSPPTVMYRVHSGNSIHSVSPFLRMAHCLMDKERAGMYPGGRERLFERYAWFGGLISFWIKRALRAGLHREALGLAASGWLMMLAAISRRAITRLGNRRRVESLQYQSGMLNARRDPEDH